MVNLEHLRQKVFLTIRGHVNHKDREVATRNFFSFSVPDMAYILEVERYL